MAQSVIINGVTYANVPSVTIPKSGGGGSSVFYDTTTANATAADILQGKSAFGAAGSISGSMTNNGWMQGGIATVDGHYTIPAGYTSGGTVSITAGEQAKIVTGNIKAGVTILGVAGKSSVVDTADATATAATIYTGATAYINGSKITGTMTTPVISQDSTTKVLSIS